LSTELHVSLGKKKSITGLVIDSTPRLKKLRQLAAIFMLLAVVCSVAYCVMSFAVPDMNVVYIQGVAEKNHLGIILKTILTFVLFYFIAIIFRTLLGNLSGKDINERVNECLRITDDMLEYVFRIRYHTSTASRTVIHFPLAEIERLVYDKELKRLTLYGNFSQADTENYVPGRQVKTKPGSLREFVIYDYFEPGLAETLRSRGIEA